MRKFGERESQSESERARESQRERESDLSLSVSLSGSLTGNLSFRLCTAMACTSEHICSTSKGNNTCQNTPQDVLSLCLQQVTAAPNFWSQLWNLREQHDERGEAAVMILILFSCPESGLQTPDSSNYIPTHQPS